MLCPRVEITLIWDRNLAASMLRHCRSSIPQESHYRPLVLAGPEIAVPGMRLFRPKLVLCLQFATEFLDIAKAIPGVNADDGVQRAVVFCVKAMDDPQRRTARGRVQDACHAFRQQAGADVLGNLPYRLAVCFFDKRVERPRLEPDFWNDAAEFRAKIVFRPGNGQIRF